MGLRFEDVAPNIGAYHGVLKDVSLDGYPRRVGSPGTTMVGGDAGFRAWFARMWPGHKVPMFISHNRFETPEAGAKVNSERIRFRTGFGDMDTGDLNGCTPQQVQAEAQKVSAFLIANGIPHSWKASGSGNPTDGPAGFHCRPEFTEAVYDIGYLQRWEPAFWRGLVAELGLHSVNLRCAEPVHMERLPYSPHVHCKKGAHVEGGHAKQWEWDGRYCVPIPWEWVRDGAWDKVESQVTHPRPVGPVRFAGGATMTLESTVRMMKWTTFAHEEAALHPELTEPLSHEVGSMAEEMKLLIPKKRCLQTLIFGSNPRDAVRIAWAVEVCALPGMSVQEATDICLKVGAEAKWLDYNPTICRTKVAYAFRKVSEGRYSPFGCHKLRADGVCIGPSCPLYRLSFPTEWAEYRRTHPNVPEEPVDSDPLASLGATA